jgi:hypothetical protein
MIGSKTLTLFGSGIGIAHVARTEDSSVLLSRRDNLKPGGSMEKSMM